MRRPLHRPLASAPIASSVLGREKEADMKGRIAMAALSALTLAVLVGAPAAQAGNNDVIERGGCSDNSDWKLKISPEDGRLEVEFEVDQNVVGDDWRVRILHNGDVVFRGLRTTRGTSGSFTVRIVEDDLAGTDRFVGKARNVSTDELCRGAASF